MNSHTDASLYHPVRVFEDEEKCKKCGMRKDGLHNCEGCLNFNYIGDMGVMGISNSSFLEAVI